MVEPPARRGPDEPTTDANLAFVQRHLAHRHLQFTPLASWPGHRGALTREAKRRGLTVREQDKSMYFFEAGRCIGGTVGLISTLVGYSAARTTRSKTFTKDLLARAGLPVPRGRHFPATRLETAVSWWAEQTTDGGLGEVVVKPADGNAGRGVSVEVRTEDQLRSAWQRARRESTRKQVILEEQVRGVDTRVFVVGDSAVAATVRVPAHVIGDGSRSVAKLAEEYEQARTVHKYLSSRPTFLDVTLLGRRGIGLDDVPATGEVVFLNGTANVSQGGVTVDVTEEIHPELLELAVRAVSAFPDLRCAGVDLLVPELGSPEDARVIELNTSANLSINQVPGYGTSRDVAAALLEEMQRGR
ncbi:ATP-grasp domain-containing protein [Nesterenkonia sp. HG001]|uniref:ATP-grasp domain-containing protein n=1 Tax=Nesterenkonia sp. HG001 TaxID=2983207 RepID=UPI002AC736C8|nr:ATP-grasp domain-containing protein [Nesterenkonia sp. HG001]MDZ5076990.1 ATP-grasp domain-containing protein [Nesterenkonia sp. HG001]